MTESACLDGHPCGLEHHPRYGSVLCVSFSYEHMGQLAFPLRHLQSRLVDPGSQTDRQKSWVVRLVRCHRPHYHGAQSLSTVLGRKIHLGWVGIRECRPSHPFPIQAYQGDVEGALLCSCEHDRHGCPAHHRHDPELGVYEHLRCAGIQVASYHRKEHLVCCKE